jgi:hypothetical protein
MRTFIAIILCLGMLACGKPKDTTTESAAVKVLKSDSLGKEGSGYYDQFKLENYLVGDMTDTSKVHIINFDCAVVVYPTHEQIEEMKKTEGEDAFYTIADDANFYQTHALQVLDSAGVKTVGTKKQFIKFVGGERQWTLDIRKQNLAAWNLILFNKSKTPRVTPPINLSYDMARTFFDMK